MTIKSLSGGSYAGTQNPTGAIAKANQNAATQPPTVIIQATASLPIKAIGDTCTPATSGTLPNQTADEGTAITSDRTAILTCQSGNWNRTSAGISGNFAATTCGTGTWVAPFGVTRVNVALLGGGGSAGVQSNASGLAGNGGGGGGYSQYTISVTSLASYSYTVGCGAVACGTIGCDGYMGGNSSFGTTGTNAYTAYGGKGGGGGDTSTIGTGGIGYTINGIAGSSRNGWVGGFGGSCGFSSPSFSCAGATNTTPAQWGGGGAGGPNGIRNGGGGFLTLTW